MTALASVVVSGWVETPHPLPPRGDVARIEPDEKEASVNRAFNEWRKKDGNKEREKKVSLNIMTKKTLSAFLRRHSYSLLSHERGVSPQNPDYMKSPPPRPIFQDSRARYQNGG
jgi:hypothetical protein